MKIRIGMFVVVAAMLAGRSLADDLLPVDSYWSGTQVHDPNHAHSKDRPAWLTVVAHDKQNITLHFWVMETNGDRGLELVGTVNPDGTFTTKPTKLLKGHATWERSILEETFSGIAKNDSVVIKWNMPSNGGSHEADLTPDEGKRHKHK